MIETLRLFGKALATNHPLSFSETNSLALRVGYIVPPRLCSTSVVSWLKEKKVNHNTTYFVSESRENILGVLTEGRFFLAKFRSGRGRVSGTSTTEKYRDYVIANLNTYLPLRGLLEAAGFEVVTESPDVDLTALTKDSLLSLLA